jgi:hypothetical protein
MYLTFTLTQNKNIELRSGDITHTLDTTQLTLLINLCEEKYYSHNNNIPSESINIGHQLYSWLDVDKGWLEKSLRNSDTQIIYLDLTQANEAEALNDQLQQLALALAHLPWELLHNGRNYLTNILPVRLVHKRETPMAGEQNRPLRLLFMATSPEDMTPILDYEKEEANILQATKNQPLSLVVEESGCVEELKNLIDSYDKDYFDVFHLTGHGIIYKEKNHGAIVPNTKIEENTPCFITETEVGETQITTVEDLAKAFGNNLHYYSNA